jgi:hypothetical protein
MAHVSVWIPVEVFEVDLILDEGGGPSPLERAVLLRISEHDTTFNILADFLSLGERMALDVVTDLWYRGYLVIDALSGLVALDPSVQLAVANENWSQLARARVRNERLSLMRELVTGRVLPDLSIERPPSPDEAVPPLINTSLREAVDEPDLMWAIRRHPEADQAFKRLLRTAQARIVRPTGAATPFQWFRLDCEVGDSGGVLELKPDKTREVLINLVADDISRAIARWAETSSDHPLAYRLLTASDATNLLAEKDLRTLLAEFRSEIENSAVVDTHLLGQRIQILRERAPILVAEVDDARRARAALDLHAGPSAVKSVFSELLGREFRQLVIASPAIDYAGVNEVCEQLGAALRTGSPEKSAIILWGQASGDETLPIACRNRLERLVSDTANEFGQRVFFSERPSRVATPFVVVDACRVLLSSLSPLAFEPDSGSFELAFTIQAESKTSVSRALLDLARERSPNFQMVDAIQFETNLDDANEVGNLAGPVDFHSATMDSIMRVESEAAYRDSEFTGLLFRAQLRDLGTVSAQLSGYYEEFGSTAVPLRDAELFRATLDLVGDSSDLRDPCLIVGIEAHRPSLSTSTIHFAIVEAIRARARRGDRTIVLIGSDRDGIAGAPPDLAALADEPCLQICRVGKRLSCAFISGARRLVIGPTGLISPRERQKYRLSEVTIGVSIENAAICSAFRQSLIEWAGPPKILLEEHFSGVSNLEGKPAPNLRTVGLSELVSSWIVGSSDQDSSELSQWNRFETFRENLKYARSLSLTLDDQLDADEMIFDQLLEIGWPESAFIRDVLSIAVLDCSSAIRDRALGRLATQAWQGREWQRCAILCCSIGGRVGFTLDQPLVDMAADIDVRLSIRTPTDYWPDRSDHVVALAALCVRAVLANADLAAYDILKAMLATPESSAAVGPPLVALAQAAVTFYEATGHAPVRTEMGRTLRARTASEQMEKLRGSFRECFRRAIAHKFENTEVRRTVATLYDKTSRFRDLDQALSRQDWRKHAPRLLAEMRLASTPSALATQASRVIEDAHREREVRLADRIVGRYLQKLQVDVHELLSLASSISAYLVDDERTVDRATAGVLSALSKTLVAQLDLLKISIAQMADNYVARPAICALVDHIAELTVVEP